MDKYILTYKDEIAFHRQERALRALNPAAYKNLLFSIYPHLKAGGFEGVTQEDGICSLRLPNMSFYERIYGYFTLQFTCQAGRIVLLGLTPADVLEQIVSAPVEYYKGYALPPKEKEKYKFKINLITMLDK